VAFIDKLLNPNESVVLDLRPHWWYWVKPALVLAVAVVAALLVRVFADGSVETTLTWVAVAAIVAAAIWLVVRYVHWMTTRFIVTTFRIVYRRGLLSKSGIEIPLERVNNVNFHQGFFEQIIGAGDLLIESAGEQGSSHFTDIRQPDDVKNVITHQIDQALGRRSNPAPAAAPDVYAQLEKLADLRDRGVITDEEFEAQKAKLLG
jgi:uncharacterized membrane protein YdbT with pleckstrin-like domain